jgi:putative PIN family toxin of toxin-antitoxin system
LAGDFELVVSDALLRELEDALAYPKLRKRVPADDAAGLMELLRRAAIAVRDTPSGSHRSADPKDDYLLALAEAEGAVLVTGDDHLLALGDELPILTARGFVESL